VSLGLSIVPHVPGIRRVLGTPAVCTAFHCLQLKVQDRVDSPINMTVVEFEQVPFQVGLSRLDSRKWITGTRCMKQVFHIMHCGGVSKCVL